jgi:hypothetical protein
VSYERKLVVAEANDCGPRGFETYDKLGISIHADKATVMRALSKCFPRGEMKKVYTVIVGSR